MTGRSARIGRLKARLRAAWAQLAATWRVKAIRFREVRAHVIAITAYVAGWLFITWSAASLLERWQVWPLGVGLLCITVGGWYGFGGFIRFGVFPLTGGDDA